MDYEYFKYNFIKSSENIVFLTWTTDKGDLYTWGVNGTGHLGLGSLGDQYFPLRVRIKTFLKTEHKLYATLRMDVMSLHILRTETRALLIKLLDTFSNSCSCRT